MKKIFICILQIALAVGFVSCEKGIEEESPFIGSGDGSVPDTGNPFWEWASVFPGPVNPGIDKPTTTVAVIGQYEPIPYSPETPILQSTGLYAGLDQPVTVDVPVGVSNLKWQIGIGQSLAAGQQAKRYQDVTTKGSLSEGANVITSSFGGYIYLYYEPEDVPTTQESINVEISNAYASYDYIKGSGPDEQRNYTNTVKERVESLKNTSISDDDNVFLYWTELRSPKIILTLGLKEMEFLTNPETLLAKYEDLVDAYLDLGGFEDVEYKLPVFRVYADIQLPNPAQHNSATASEDERRAPGYPIGVLKAESMRGTTYRDERRYMNLNHTLDFGYWNRANIGVAMTHSSFQMTTASDWASAVWIKWPYLRVANMYYCQQISDGAYWGSDIYLNQIGDFAKVLTDKQLAGIDPYKDVDAKRPWFKANFRNHPGGGGTATEKVNGDQAGNVYGNDSDTRNYEAGRVAVFMQLVQQYGWGILKYINRRAREVDFINEYEQDAHDFFAMAACEYADADLRPFFRWHQFPYTAHVVQFIRNNGFEAKQLPKTYVDGDRNYYFFDWPQAAATFFPNNIPDINPDKWSGDPAGKVGSWPEKPYYKEIFQAGTDKWTPYLEVVETNYTRVGPLPVGINDGSAYDGDWIPTASQDNESSKNQMGFLISSYLNQRTDDANNGIKYYFDNDWINSGYIHRLKGGFSQGGGDFCPNYAIIDVDFGKPIKLNAIKTRQPKWDFGSGGNGSAFANYLLYIQYYVEPLYYAPSDPNDPSSPEIEVKSGSRNGEWIPDPANNPNRMVWTGINQHTEAHIPNPNNTVPYPGRTKDKTPGETVNDVGNWGFRQGGYWAHVNTRFPIHEYNALNQDWYTGITWLMRDGWNRSYVYYLEETIETRRLRFWIRPSLVLNNSGAGTTAGERGGDFGWQGTNGAWHVRLREIAFGLIDTEVPAPGTIPQPHETYKGMEDGLYYAPWDGVKYYQAASRNYGGEADNGAY